MVNAPRGKPQASHKPIPQWLEVLPWQELALCREVDPELFFPPPKNKATEAKRVCAACRVKYECLDYALKRPALEGVWGGVAERERKKMRQRMRGAA